MFAEILNSHCFTYSRLTNEQLPLGRLLVLLKGTYKKKIYLMFPSHSPDFQSS